MQARALECAGAQVQTAQICLPKIAIREIEVRAIETAQIRTTEITGTQIMRFRRLALSVELVDEPLTQGLVERVGRLA